MPSRRKPQVGINLEPLVYEIMRDWEIRTPTSKTIICTAGLLCLRGLKDRDRQRAFVLAGRVNEGKLTWERACEIQGLEAEKYDAALEMLIAEELRAIGEDDERAPESGKRKGKRD